MAKTYSAPRGTADVLPAQSGRWQYIENKLRAVCARYGYGEIRLPTFEHTEVFARGVGDTTDVVNKEMYTFVDRGERSITLRPEGTANTVRAALEHGLLAGTLPVRCYYLMSCFRYEKPQAGRLREYHTLGIEQLGSAQPDADVEVILAASAMLRECGVSGVRLELNSIGCPKCRAAYREALHDYFAAHTDRLCETCRDRLERNPMRILDCKSEVCSDIAKDAPVILDYLCDECREHFAAVKTGLGDCGVEFTVNPRIVRGLDYYTRTVFEFIHSGAVAQGTVLGGGRYDGLVETLGGKPTPAIGFGMGLERLLSVMEAEGVAFPADAVPDLFVCYVGDDARRRTALVCEQLRRLGVRAEYDITGRSLKAQFKYADRTGARYSAVVGDDEMNSGSVTLKSMDGSGESNCPLSAEQIKSRIYKEQQ